jgi:excisionase family DNA binding protein
MIVPQVTPPPGGHPAALGASDQVGDRHEDPHAAAKAQTSAIPAGASSTRVPHRTDGASTYLTPAAAARLLQLSESGVRRWAREGKLRSRKLGRLTRIERASVERCLPPFPPDPAPPAAPAAGPPPTTPRLTDDDLAALVAQWPPAAQLRLAARLLNQACDADTAARRADTGSSPAGRER